jgi:hypothetical protein
MAKQADTKAAPEKLRSAVSPLSAEEEVARGKFNDKLNRSEDRLRRELANDAAVDAAISAFKGMAYVDTQLVERLNKHRHPWKFAYDHVKAAEAKGDIQPVVTGSIH